MASELDGSAPVNLDGLTTAEVEQLSLIHI